MKTRNKLLLVLAVAFTVRLCLIVLFKTYEHPMMWEYETVVNNLLSGKGFLFHYFDTPYRSFNAPLYNFLCAGIYLLTNHSYFAVLLVQSVFSVFLALAIFGIAKYMFDENVAFLSALLVSLHPGFIYYDVFNLIPLSIDSFFIAAVTLSFLKFKDRATALNMSFVGMLVGLGVLTRGIIGALLPYLGLYIILFADNMKAREKARSIACLILGTFLVIAPWIIRNYIVQKQFVFIVSTSGENFWRGNNKYAVGTSLNSECKPIISLWPEDFRKEVFSLDEMGQKRFFEKEAFDFIRQDPAGFVRRYIKKIYYFWWFSPQSGIIYPESYLAVYKYVYSVLLFFSLFGLILAAFFRQKAVRAGAWLIIFVFMAIFMTQSLFYVEGRHRWLIEPMLIIFFSYGASEFYRLSKIRRMAIR